MPISRRLSLRSLNASMSVPPPPPEPLPPPTGFSTLSPDIIRNISDQYKEHTDQYTPTDLFEAQKEDRRLSRIEANMRASAAGLAGFGLAQARERERVINTLKQKLRNKEDVRNWLSKGSINLADRGVPPTYSVLYPQAPRRLLSPNHPFWEGINDMLDTPTSDFNSIFRDAMGEGAQGETP